jgi:hypothetical protein
MNVTMWLSLVGILATNITLVIGAVWRVSAVIQKVIGRLDGIVERMDLSNKHTEQRITMLEANIQTQNTTIADLQKRMTAFELQQMIMMNKKGE